MIRNKTEQNVPQKKNGRVPYLELCDAMPSLDEKEDIDKAQNVSLGILPINQSAFQMEMFQTLNISSFFVHLS